MLGCDFLRFSQHSSKVKFAGLGPETNEATVPAQGQGIQHDGVVGQVVILCPNCVMPKPLGHLFQQCETALLEEAALGQ